jgi:hypothetical protein
MPTSALFVMLELACGTLQCNSLSPSLIIIRILVILQSALSTCFCVFITSIPIVYILSCRNHAVYNQCLVYLIYPACLNQPFDISPVIQPHASRIAPMGSASRRIKYPFRRIYAFTVERHQHMYLNQEEIVLTSAKRLLNGVQIGRVCRQKEDMAAKSLHKL